MDGRLPAHLEVGGLIRQVNAAGGFATVLHKGERDAGTILVVMIRNGLTDAIYERLPHTDGTRSWTLVATQVSGKEEETQEWLARRARFDPDLWIVELDIANGERFIGSPGTQG